MLKKLTRLGAVLAAAALLASAASALTPQQLGDILKENYCGDIPRQVWAQTTVDGMLDVLGDRYTCCLTAEEYADFLTQMKESGAQGATASASLEDEHICLINLRAFGADTPGLVRAAIEKHDPDTDRWIVDLRDNRGGELESAVNSVAAFTGGSKLAYLRDKDDKVYVSKAESGSLTMDPVIVLVSDKTASGGELFAADVRDKRAGLVIGSRTYGKGVAQTAFTKTEYPDAFADGSALLVTTERLFSSYMNSNNVIGVIPHLVVEDDLVEDVARTLCASAPGSDNTGYLRIHLAGWRWFVDTAAASADGLKALMESLPPQTEVYIGQGGIAWSRTTPAAYCSGGAGYRYNCFPDVAGSPYADAINALKVCGILKGDQNGNYNPKVSLDRATLCALLAQAMNYPKSAAAPAFADTPADAWYTPYVTTLSAMGVVNGYDDGLFHPTDPIPHQQFMTILARIAAGTNHRTYAAQKAGPDAETLASGRYNSYDPWARTGAWLLDGAWHADVTAIDPKGPTLREEAAYDLWSMLCTLGILSR